MAHLAKSRAAYVKLYEWLESIPLGFSPLRTLATMNHCLYCDSSRGGKAYQHQVCLQLMGRCSALTIALNIERHSAPGASTVASVAGIKHAWTIDLADGQVLQFHAILKTDRFKSGGHQPGSLDALPILSPPTSPRK